MTATININLNDTASVVLTPTGADAYNAWERKFKPLAGVSRRKLKQGDILTEQLWQLFQIFGDSLYLGMPEVPFEGNVLSVRRDGA